MVTLVPPALNLVYTLIGPHLKHEKRAGIANPGSPGYHTSREDLIRQGRSDDYSIQCPADRRGDPRYASGIDITFTDLAELVMVHTRLRKACTPDRQGDADPRIECVREIIGTLDGRNVSGYNRVATGSGTRSRVGWIPSRFSDPSHLWHEHISVLRDRCDDENDMRGLAEVIAGLAPGTLGWRGARAKKPAYLPIHYVDPTKVRTFLWGVRHSTGERVHQRIPGFAITTGVRVVRIDGVDWLLTEAGYRYHLGYLTTVPAGQALPVRDAA